MRVRLRFSKDGKIRFTSHRDVARVWERAFRRAALPLSYTEGFSPRPKVSFGLALPTGYESDGEYLDVDLSRPVPLEGLCERLTALLPVGLVAQVAAEVDPRERSLQQDIDWCSWSIELLDTSPEDAATQVAAVLAAEELVVTRSRKGVEVTEDIRAGIGSLTVAGPMPERPGTVLHADLVAHPRALRPSELVAAGWPDGELLRARRTHQWIERDGAREEPLPLPDGATAAPHAELRAS